MFRGEKMVSWKKLGIIVWATVSLIAFAGCKTSVTDKTVDITMNGVQVQGSYTGDFENDVPNGKGKIKGVDAANKSWSYEGELKDGKFNGSGKLTFKKLIAPNHMVTVLVTHVEEGTFKDGVLVNGTDKVDGELVYKGQFNSKGQYEGEGEEYASNGGIKYKGTFKNGLPRVPAVKLGENVSYGGWTYKITKAYIVPNGENDSPSMKHVAIQIEITNNQSEPLSAFNGIGSMVLIDDKGTMYQIDPEVTVQQSIHTPPLVMFIDSMVPNVSYTTLLSYIVPRNVNSFEFVSKEGLGKATPIQFTVQ